MVKFEIQSSEGGRKEADLEMLTHQGVLMKSLGIAGPVLGMGN